MPTKDQDSEISLVALDKQYASDRDAVLSSLDKVFSSGDFLNGEPVKRLEHELSVYLGVEHVVALNSGTDALILGLSALGIGPGDEVITPPNSFVASTAAIVHLGATPVFADVLQDQTIDPASIERAITPKTKAVMPVHLTGRMCDMRAINDVANLHGIKVVEDAAQSFNSKIDGKQSGTFGDIGCFSANPLKNLGAAGDAGFIATNEKTFADHACLMRDHGRIDRSTIGRFGLVSRMDSIQASILSLRLKNVESTCLQRIANARYYQDTIVNPGVSVPMSREGIVDTYHLFVLQSEKRDLLAEYLTGQRIQCAVHYPIPIHLQPAAKGLGYKEGDFPVAERLARQVLSIPVHQFLSRSDIETVAEAINTFDY